MRVDGRFFFYYFSTVFGLVALDGSAKSTVESVRRPMITDLAISVPPLPVQQEIAEYLDRDTAQIDELIGEQEALTASLAERRQSVITQAVTSAGLVSSGIRLKHVLVSVTQGWSPQCETVSADGIVEWGVLKTGCVNRGIFRATENKMLPPEVEPRPATAVRPEHLVVCRASTRDLVGSAAVVGARFPRLMLSDKLYALTLDDRLAEPRFVAHVLGTRKYRDLIELEASGASHSMQNISQSDIVNLPMDLPGLDDQRRILDNLDEKTAKIDALVAECRGLIALLKERRSALISAAVTGKIDVRQARSSTAEP